MHTLHQAFEGYQCPLFRPYYVGLCNGHVSPYIPSTAERRKYCNQAEYRQCSIFARYNTAFVSGQPPVQAP